MDKNTGNIIWDKKGNVISNIEAKNSRIFYLESDGYLVVLNQQSGQEIVRIGFSSGNFILPEPNKVIGGYYVAADSKGETIFTSFGDSCQLYAFELVD